MTTPTEYSQAELDQAFTLVQNPKDWKAPINAVVPGHKLAVVQRAIVHFTATHPTAAPEPGQVDAVRVKARGYRLGPAGDH